MATLQYSQVLAGGPGWTRVALPDGRVVTMHGDRAMRNNNPGNIEYGPFTRQRGALGSDGRFAVFPSRDAGLQAQAALIFDSPSYRNLTLQEAIARYAPAFENNTARYANTVAAMSGVPLDTLMSDIPAEQRQGVLEAMHSVEGNTSARGVLDETGVTHWNTDTTYAPTPELSPQPSLPGTMPTYPNAPFGVVERAPLAPLNVPPAPQPATFAAPVTPVERAALPSVEDVAKAKAYSDYGASRRAGIAAPPSLPDTAPVPTLLSPEQDYFGPKVTIPTAPSQAKIDAYQEYGRSRMAPEARSTPQIDPITAQATGKVAVGAPMAGDFATTVPPMADNTPVAPGFPAAPPQAGFPAPPPAPGRTARTEAAKGAALGALKGGPIGAVLGGLIGPGMSQIRGNIRSNAQGFGRINPLTGFLGAYRGMFGNVGRLGGLVSPPTYATPYSVGSGYSAIGGVFGAPAGATALSRSNPNISFTSLGNGMVSRTNKETGVTYSMAPGSYDAGPGGKSSGKSKSK